MNPNRRKPGLKSKPRFVKLEVSLELVAGSSQRVKRASLTNSLPVLSRFMCVALLLLVARRGLLGLLAREVNELSLLLLLTRLMELRVSDEGGLNSFEPEGQSRSLVRANRAHKSLIPSLEVSCLRNQRNSNERKG